MFDKVHNMFNVRTGKPDALLSFEQHLKTILARRNSLSTTRALNSLTLTFMYYRQRTTSLVHANDIRHVQVCPYVPTPAPLHVVSQLRAVSSRLA